jgi:hypothetical protein
LFQISSREVHGDTPQFDTHFGDRTGNVRKIFLSTLPANKPGYGFWRRGAELVRVSTHVALTNTMP